MSKEFDRKASVVATAWEVLDKNDEWKPILEHFDLGFPYAWLHYSGQGTLKAEGRRQVTDTYDFLLKALDIDDNEEYYSFWSLLDAHNKEG